MNNASISLFSTPFQIQPGYPFLNNCVLNLPPKIYWNLLKLVVYFTFITQINLLTKFLSIFFSINNLLPINTFLLRQMYSSNKMCINIYSLWNKRHHKSLLATNLNRVWQGVSLDIFLSFEFSPKVFYSNFASAVFVMKTLLWILQLWTK